MICLNSPYSPQSHHINDIQSERAPTSSYNNAALLAFKDLFVLNHCLLLHFLTLQIMKKVKSIGVTVRGNLEEGGLDFKRQQKNGKEMIGSNIIQ